MLFKSITILKKKICFPVLFRNCHNKSEVRVRFAPSPTGYLHLGGLRTALYNYLFAKAHNGKFILRIEDTDQTRLVKGATENLINDLNWSGIKIDEGPTKGGNYGPYIQSERLKIYRQEIKTLIENGSAYYCFCPERRLELLRKEAIRTRQVPKYDNKCRYLTPVQIAAKIAKNEEFCIRFKLTSYSEPLHDLVYGDCVYDVSENEGDPVIIKSDGYPTYHFANVVDDHFMKISHVFRGVEWHISTTKHLLIYKAFGWEPPKFGHLPLLVNSDGTKLSKRQGDIQINQYRQKGIFPQALINYIITAGGGFSREQSLKSKSYSMAELTTQFDITKVNLNPSKLNPDLLSEFNRLEIIRHVTENDSCEILIENIRDMVKKAYPENLENLDLDSRHIKNVLKWAVHRITTLIDLVEGNLAFLWIRPNTDIKTTFNQDNLNDLIEILGSTERFEKIQLNELLKIYSNQKKIKFSKLMKELRTVLSGLNEGPGVAEMMEILGKQTTLQRISYLREKK